MAIDDTTTGDVIPEVPVIDRVEGLQRCGYPMNDAGAPVGVAPTDWTTDGE